MPKHASIACRQQADVEGMRKKIMREKMKEEIKKPRKNKESKAENISKDV